MRAGRVHDIQCAMYPHATSVGARTCEFLHRRRHLAHQLRDGDDLVILPPIRFGRLSGLFQQHPIVWPIPEYTTPTLSVKSLILRTVVSSMSVEGSFFSVASTTPLVALMPSEIAPAWTALSAYSICMSLPLGLKVVSEKEYCRHGSGLHVTVTVVS